MKGGDRRHLNIAMFRIILSGDKVISSHAFLRPYFNPFPNDTEILDSFKLKDSADDYFKFDENGRKFFIQVENTVGKGEIARYEQFLLFPLCFQKACTAKT